MADLFDLPFEDEPVDPVDAVDAERPPAPRPERAAGSAPPARRPPAAVPDPGPAISPRRALSVSQLTARLRDTLESAFYEVWVEGELSNCRLWNTGHFYFTLKDTGAQIKGVIFRSALRYLKFKPEDGLKIVARGRVSVYEPKGEYQIVCEHLEPQGFGALQLAFEQLKARLQDEGLFDAARKRALPALPRRIGVVTSLDGAAVRDILKVLARRHSTACVVIRPARVQGEGASLDIARGLKALGRVDGVDVIIVGRGGGSIEDLWAFNEEIVARAIVLCPVPVISAVGHETDVTIADFVADLRAPTPSAAAEMVVAAKDEFRARIDRLTGRLRGAARGRVQLLGRRMHLLAGRPALSAYPARLANRGRHVAELTHALARSGRASVLARERQLHHLARRLDACDLRRRLGTVRARVAGADGRAAAAMSRELHRRQATLGECAARLESLSPIAVLGRGYAVCWNAERTRIVRDAATASPGDRVRVTLARGELACEVRDASTDGPDE
jgi:exodeoxyribonuclease VII large subunit